MMKKTTRLFASALPAFMLAFAGSSFASTCKDLPTAAELKAALQEVVPGADPATGVSGQAAGLNGGVGAPEWMAMVDSSGIVCAVVHSLDDGVDVTSKTGIIHRPLAVFAATTANSYSRDGIGVSTANLYLHVANQQGFDAEINSGLNGLNNLNFNVYGGDAKTWGTPKDPMVGKRIGGANMQGGGLPLYNSSKIKVGGLGVSGDFRCTDHVVAWKVREKLRDGAYTAHNNPLGLAYDPNNPKNPSNGTDAMIQDISPTTGKSASGFGYPVCLINNPTAQNDGGAIIRSNGNEK